MSFLTARLAQSLKKSLTLNNRSYSKNTMRFYEPLEVATGKDRAELLALQKGDDDPFRMNAIKRRPSSKSNPIPVPSYFNSRMVGCVCEEDSYHIVWFWLHMDEEPKRCECGHWFKLEKYNLD